MDECITRLIASGFSPENAAKICETYRADGDGLEAFVCSCEMYDPLKEADNGL